MEFPILRVITFSSLENLLVQKITDPVHLSLAEVYCTPSFPPDYHIFNVSPLDVPPIFFKALLYIAALSSNMSGGYNCALYSVVYSNTPRCKLCYIILQVTQ